jgi:hypothetical protein
MAYTDEFGNIFGTAEDFDYFGDAAGDIFYNTADDPWTGGDVFDWAGANEDLRSIWTKYGQSGLDLLKGAFQKDGKTDWRAIATAGGALLPLLERVFGGSSAPRPTGYQGGIPELTAVRQAVPQTYDPNRRPGSGGQRYFTDVQYVPKTGDTAADALAAAQTAAGEQATGLAALNQANPANQPASPVQTMARGGIVGLQDGGFVVPADVVSHLGNGSSDAGLRHLQKRGAVPLRGRGDGMSDSNRTMINNRQPAAVAHEEAYFPPERAQAMGGPERLYAMMNRIRKDRTGTTQQGRQINPNKYLG